MNVSLHWLSILLLLVLSGLSSCKDDTHQPSSVSDIEKSYFEDYDSPRHKWGFIDKKGKEVIKPIFDMVKDLTAAKVAANYKGKWGYIDNAGNNQIPFQYKQAYDFIGETTFVQDFDNRWLLINMIGEVIDTLSQHEVQDCNDEIALVKVGVLYGAINKADGSELLPVKYDQIIPVDGGFILSEGGSYGLELNEKVILNYDYDRIYSPVNGIYRLKRNGKYQFFKPGHAPSSTSYERAEPFHYELTVVRVDGKYSLIDQDLNEIRKLDFDKVSYAGDNKWKYKKQGKWGLLDSIGLELCSPRYTLLNRYSDERIVAASNDEWGYLDQEGQPAIPFKYPLVWDFHDGLARVIHRHGIGFIDKSGKLVIKDKFFEVRDFYGGKARFQTF